MSRIDQINQVTNRVIHQLNHQAKLEADRKEFPIMLWEKPLGTFVDCFKSQLEKKIERTEAEMKFLAKYGAVIMFNEVWYAKNAITPFDKVGIFTHGGIRRLTTMSI